MKLRDYIKINCSNSIPVFAKKYGVTRQTVYNWLKDSSIKMDGDKVKKTLGTSIDR